MKPTNSAGQPNVNRPINTNSVPETIFSGEEQAAGVKSSVVPADEIRDLDVRAPRYTSYPTADRFSENFDAADYARHLSARSPSTGGPLSIYMHIPFCESLCYYCACNKSITQRYEKAIPYVQHLISEMQLVDQFLGGDRSLSQIHWGGGTPTYLRPAEITALMRGLRQYVDVQDDGEYSIEIDPRTADDEKISVLAAEGFNRMSLGVQDFDPDVQRAVNRVQSIELTQHVLESARAAGFQSTNFDLIYGLPLQSVERYSRTIDAVIQMRPERIALYNYAHLPERFKAQRRINDEDMPAAAEKLAIFEMTSEKLDSSGYEYIGMDHFALPNDELAVAHRNGKLHRNFQGYSTKPECDLVALGASAISRVGSSYSQNHRGINDYSDQVVQSKLPTLRGIELNSDDILRRAVIMAIMCQGHISKTAIEATYNIQFDRYFENELLAIRPLEELGFVQLESDAVQVTATGRRKALRVTAAIFDRYIQNNKQRQSFSRVL